ncbi:MAG: aldehyde ferredoxin oxidoreductase family protein [Candidatus Hermodarchaeota archaeon]
MNKGFYGKILWIDLKNNSFKEEQLSNEIYREFLGGYGLACKLIYDNTKPKYEPLGSESIFGFFPGLLTGTPAPFSGRYMVAGKSPLTGTWGDANSGGTFGPEIKKCGYDAILIKGKAETPKYVAIIDDNKEIYDASEIWGLDIIEAENKLKKKHGKFIKTAGIGQAGEKLSLIAGVANDKGRIAARSGLGAIMGSKNLKMLVLKGKNRVDYHNRDEFIKYIKMYNDSSSLKEPGFLTKRVLNVVPKMAKMIRRFNMDMGGSPSLMRQVWHRFGTSSGNTLCAEIGDSPIKNWSGIGMYDYPYEISKDISAREIEKYKIKEYGCFSCPVQCGGILKVPELNLEETHLPEYETCAAFGGMLLNHDLMSIFEINELCNRAAIDTISTGGTVAFAIECYENGILTKKDIDGLDLNWGNSRAIVELVKKIIKREGIGDLLADGSKIAAERIGNGSDKFAIHALGQEPGMHNPRHFPSLGMSYAFDPTPGRHTTASIDLIAGMRDPETYLKGLKLPEKWREDMLEKAKAQKIINGMYQCVSCLGLCNMSAYFGQYPLIELIESLTNWKFTIEDLVETGLRIQTLRQAFTLREGVNIASNELNSRIYGDPPDDKGPKQGITIDYRNFYKLVCQEYGWNSENGYPLKDTLKTLNLEHVINDLYQIKAIDIQV